MTLDVWLMLGWFSLVVWGLVLWFLAGAEELRGDDDDWPGSRL